MASWAQAHSEVAAVVRRELERWFEGLIRDGKESYSYAIGSELVSGIHQHTHTHTRRADLGLIISSEVSSRVSRVSLDAFSCNEVANSFYLTHQCEAIGKGCQKDWVEKALEASSFWWECLNPFTRSVLAWAEEVSYLKWWSYHNLGPWISGPPNLGERWTFGPGEGELKEKDDSKGKSPDSEVSQIIPTRKSWKMQNKVISRLEGNQAQKTEEPEKAF